MPKTAKAKNTRRFQPPTKSDRRKDSMVAISLWLPKGMFERIETEVARLETTKSDYIREAIKFTWECASEVDGVAQ